MRNRHQIQVSDRLFTPSRKSFWGLNAANFLFAEVVSVFLPFLNAYLEIHHWSYDRIGTATAISGLGSLLFYAPAGLLTDRIQSRRLLLGSSAIFMSFIFAFVPLAVDQDVKIYILLFLFGMAGTFIVPILATLALSLAGYDAFDSTLGENQSWNHFGGIAGALIALYSVRYFGIESIFYFTSIICLLAAFSLLLIGGRDLKPNLSQEKERNTKERLNWRNNIKFIFENQALRTLIICTGLFQIANAPLLSLSGLYVKSLGGKDSLIAWIIFINTAAMIPASWLTGKTSSTRRKPIFSIAFILLPVQMLLCSVSSDPAFILISQVLSGVSAGIYGVISALVCSDLTHERGGFNFLIGMIHATFALGSIAGAIIQGFTTENFGFPTAFITLFGFSALGALIFALKMPETH